MLLYEYSLCFLYYGLCQKCVFYYLFLRHLLSTNILVCTGVFCHVYSINNGHLFLTFERGNPGKISTHFPHSHVTV
jgi:hypothetical protein